MKYYVLEHGQTLGPIEGAELRRKLEVDVRPNPDLQVNPVGASSWVRVCELQEFGDLFVTPASEVPKGRANILGWLGHMLILGLGGFVVLIGVLIAIGGLIAGKVLGVSVLLTLLGGLVYGLWRLDRGIYSGGPRDRSTKPSKRRRPIGARSAQLAPSRQQAPANSQRLDASLQDGAGLRKHSLELSETSRWTGGPVQREVRADDVWIPAANPVDLHGLHISAGMLYVGSGLAAVQEYGGLEPSLLDPKAKVNLSSPDTAGEGLDYWPSYSRISPAARGAYLLWLAGGRQDPNTPIGYVFLFFYGLERRLLFDARTSATARDEVPLLVQEVQRLHSTYGDSSQSFKRYSKSLLEMCRVVYASGALGDGEPPPAREHYELPLDLAAGLGERLISESPITGPWAFAWLLSHPDARLRTPARRCSKEFKKLFLLRFQQKYPKGLKVKPNKRRLTCDYHPASGGLRGCSIQLEHLPDVRALSGPVNKFRVIADACTDELDAYSRLLGRNPDAAGTLQAFALLPPELAEVSEPEDAQELNRWIRERLLGHPRAVVPSRDLMKQWEHQNPEKFSKKEAVAFAQVLERLGFGMEPDPRFGGPPHKAQGAAVVFELGPKPIGVASREYGAATILLHLAAIVAAADGVVSEEEETHLEQHLEQAMHLEESEKVRLRAHLSWLLSEPPGTAGLKKRLETLSPQLKHQVAEFAVSVAGADGRIDPAEVKALQKLYAMLGLDPESVFADIHGMSSSPATAPVTVAIGLKKTGGRRLPPPPASTTQSKAEPSFELDMERVKAKLKDTAEVASLLSQIFVEDEEPADDALAEPAVAADESSKLGLDAGYMKLLLSLQGSSELGGQEFEERCRRLNLLPDAAFEALNDAAFDHVDSPLLIGEDPIEIDVEIFEEMCSK